MPAPSPPCPTRPPLPFPPERSCAREGIGSNAWRPAEKLHRTNADSGTCDGHGLAGDTWLAATAQGVFRSTDSGASWTPVLTPAAGTAFPGGADYLTIAAQGQNVFLGRRTGIVASHDNGATWQPLALPTGLTALASLELTPNGTLWAGGREGVFFSQDQGHTWTLLNRLPVVAVNGLNWDRR